LSGGVGIVAAGADARRDRSTDEPNGEHDREHADMPQQRLGSFHVADERAESRSNALDTAQNRAALRSSLHS
jgi:hypothetical protein